jgi:hypothetical protein
MKKGLLFSVAAFLLCHGSAQAIEVYDLRSAWDAAFIGPRWDVDLESDPNSLTKGSTLEAESPIWLPPDFDSSFSFDRDLNVQRGIGWHNYIDTSSGADDPLVLGTDSAVHQLTGTFTMAQGKFGFEVLPYESGEITLTLSDGTIYSKQVYHDGAPQFLGWVNDSKYERIESFTVSGKSGFLIGNFVVPDGGTTLLLLGIGLVALAGLRRRSQGRTA